MKIRLFVFSGFFCCLQIFGCSNKNDVHISRNESGQTLTLKVTANKNDKNTRYKESFNTEGMSKQEKDSVVDHILDSLGVKR